VITCSNCGKQHENSKGICPVCSVPSRVVKRQRERPSETLGTILRTYELRPTSAKASFWPLAELYC